MFVQGLNELRKGFRLTIKVDEDEIVPDLRSYLPHAVTGRIKVFQFPDTYSADVWGVRQLSVQLKGPGMVRTSKHFFHPSRFGNQDMSSVGTNIMKNTQLMVLSPQNQ